MRAPTGQGFAFIPRALVAQPKAFGVAAGILDPVHGVSAADERYRAAMLQHVMAVAVRSELLRGEGVSPAVFVSRFEGRGFGVDRVRRIFRGETMAQLTDVVFWTTQLPPVAEIISECIASGFSDESPPPVGENVTAHVVDDEPAEWVRKAAFNALLRQTQAEAGIRPRDAQPPSVARVFGTAAPAVRRSPQNPYDQTARRMR